MTDGEHEGRALEEAGDDALAQSISYALKRDRKALRKLESRDDDGHFQLARRIVEHLRLCGYRFLRKPRDWRNPMSALQPPKSDEG